MPVVVVESPAKAKTIAKYLGQDYKVVASFGHVRDLSPIDGSVDPDHNFDMKWQVPKASASHITAIADAIKKDPVLILATDPDREGEAISWHITEALRKKRGVKLDGEPKRVVFNSVTPDSVRDAMANPRQIDMELVDAYIARRALDYLVGFHLSPVLWRKLPGARSAGRVQSVCVRIIVEREREIETFKRTEFWSVTAEFTTPSGQKFTSLLTILDGKKLSAHGLSSESAATAAVEAIKGRNFSVASVQAKPAKSNPPPPFMTATLQQEASRKLRMPPSVTMRVAQQLYERGLITYMRTDAVFMVPQAVQAVRKTILQRFGQEYLPKSARAFKSKAKNAQEAHECIRPTYPEKDAYNANLTDSDQRRLYELIWNRTVASQMQPAVFVQTRVEILSDDHSTGLRATGRITKFDGYQAVYKEGRDEPERDSDLSPNAQLNSKSPLPPLCENDSLERGEVKPAQHFTKPPPRYTEASLVKEMVELGIGRPSTYSSIVSTIQDRGYVLRQSRQLVPEPVGRLLVLFLKLYFERYVQFKFTAEMEQDLDDIAGGRKKRNAVLSGFWGDFSSAVGSASELQLADVLDRLSDILVPVLIPPSEDRTDARACPRCEDGRLVLRSSRRNVYVGCTNSPNCYFKRSFDGSESREIGIDPETNLPITLQIGGGYGPYLQLGLVGDDNKKPKRAGIPKDIDPACVDLQTALTLLSLPLTIGLHPDDNEPIVLGIGPYGPYLRHAGVYANMKSTAEALSVEMKMAVELLAQAKEKKAKAAPTKTLGDHPDGGVITTSAGRFGPYVKWNRIYASIPKDTDPNSVTLDGAIQLLAEKAKKSTATKKTARTRKSTTRRKSTTARKSTTVKKAPQKRKHAATN